MVGVLALGLSAASAARADIAVPRHRIRPVRTLVLRSLFIAEAEAPDADARHLMHEVRRSLRRNRSRLRRCLADVDLREDPVRDRTRRVTGRMRFSRSGRPDVSIVRARGIPRAARQCVLEVARSVSGPAPRGEVTLTFVYAVQ